MLFCQLDAGRGMNLALWWASYRDSLDVVKLLCERGADINFITPEDSTPLDEALAAGKSEIADYLRAQGARPRAEL